jgi:hypothetical protein
VLAISALIVLIVWILVAIIRDHPERKPGNLAPIQLISALGAWALVLANASAIAIAIRDGSGILLCTATATFAVALISFLRDAGSIADRETPESVKLVVDDLKQLLGGAPRLGIDSLEAVVVGGRSPGIGVAVARQGRVIVRVRHDVAEWFERHQQKGGAGAEVAASFARFTVLHELAHVLNGDHRTFRFVRSVLIANLVWIAGVVGVAASLVFASGASATPLVVAGTIILLFVTQSLVARRFIAERERLADWRAMQTLPPADAARLLERRGRRRGVANPTELEKLMTDLKVQAPPRDGGFVSRLIALVWPEGDDIHQRSERAGGDRAGGAPRPVLWAALMGMQCGFLSMSLVLAVMLAAARWIDPQPYISSLWITAIMTLVGAPAVIFCELRIDPARMSVRKVSHAGRRIVVGIVFYLAFIGSALALYGFQIRLDVAAIPPAPYFAAVLVSIPAVLSLGIWMAGMTGVRDGGGELQTTPRASLIEVFPLLAGIALLVPLSVTASQWLGTGSFRSGRWVPLMLMSFAGFVVSTGMARSTNPALRMIAPMAMLDTPAPVYGFRVFWRDFYVDLSRTTLARGAAATMAVQVVALPFFVVGVALLMQAMLGVFPANMTLAVTFFGAFGVMALILVIPDRYRAYSGPSARLLDTGWLRILDALLAAARTANPAAGDRLNGSLARWLRNERFPDALLPEPRTVWPLAPLLILVKLARETGQWDVLERWRGRIEHSLRQIISNDAVALGPRQPPSMHWTTVAATIIDEAELRGAFPFERMLDRIETLLDERLEHGTTNLLTDLVAACRLLRRHGRPGPDPRRVRSFVRSSSLVSRPVLRQSLAELCELADLTADAELRERLAPIVRSRSWEGLQLNPRKDVLLVLDCYLAAACLGELDARQQAAGVIIGELAERVSGELMAVVTGER